MADVTPVAFLPVRDPEGRGATDFAVGSEEYIRGLLAGWRSNPPKEVKPDDSHNPVTEPDFTHESALTDALSRAVDFGLSQYELIMVAGITPSLFEGLIARERVLRPAIETAKLVDEDDKAAMYSLSEDQYLDLMSKRDDLNSLIAGVASLPKATLMSIVAAFDTLVVDIVSKMLYLGSSDWLQKTDRHVSAARLATATSMEELVQELLAEEMYQFSRGSHDEQARYI